VSANCHAVWLALSVLVVNKLVCALCVMCCMLGAGRLLDKPLSQSML
jgi:hypothetical protein